MIDALFLVLMGNNVALFDLIRRDPARVRDAVAWWLRGDGRLRREARQPGRRRALEARQRQRHLARRRRRRRDAAAGDRRDRGGGARRSGLPHPVHVHCNNLGVAGNWRTTMDTLRTIEGRRAHLAHLQFHAYGGRPGGRMRSQGAGDRGVPRRASRSSAPTSGR